MKTFAREVRLRTSVVCQRSYCFTKNWSVMLVITKLKYFTKILRRFHLYLQNFIPLSLIKIGAQFHRRYLWSWLDDRVFKYACSPSQYTHVFARSWRARFLGLQVLPESPFMRSCSPDMSYIHICSLLPFQTFERLGGALIQASSLSILVDQDPGLHLMFEEISRSRDCSLRPSNDK